MNFNNLTKKHSPTLLRRADLNPNPIAQLMEWLKEAREAHVHEYNAMALATATKEGRPSCRIVLLKQVDENGLVFFTNYESRKSKELEQNPYAMANLFWVKQMRQVGVEGVVVKTSAEESAEYFSHRPRGSRLAAWTSIQDQAIPSRDFLEGRYSEIESTYKNKEIPLPPFWGGFRLIPHRIEFWQGGKHRLHDRFHYVLEGGAWKIERLSP